MDIPLSFRTTSRFSFKAPGVIKSLGGHTGPQDAVTDHHDICRDSPLTCAASAIPKAAPMEVLVPYTEGVVGTLVAVGESPTAHRVSVGSPYARPSSSAGSAGRQLSGSQRRSAGRSMREINGKRLAAERETRDLGVAYPAPVGIEGRGSSLVQPCLMRVRENVRVR